MQCMICSMQELLVIIMCAPGGYIRISGGLQSRPKIFEPPRETYNNSYIGEHVGSYQAVTR